MTNSITIVTITRGRPELLRRAMASVQYQDCTADLCHIILIDACESTKASLDGDSSLPSNVVWQYMPRDANDQSGPQRLAFLRNLSAQIAVTDWISFLDDDNELEPNHLSSLLDCALLTGCPAVHSQRTIHWPDGSPYLEERCPWHRDLAQARELYIDYCRKGIFEVGSNIIRDRIDPYGTEDPVYFADTSEWLLKRQLLIDFPISTQFTFDDCVNRVAEDGKLLQSLLGRNVPIAGTGLPTLKYYLGGYSNTFYEGQSVGSWF